MNAHLKAGNAFKSATTYLYLILLVLSLLLKPTRKVLLFGRFFPSILLGRFEGREIMKFRTLMLVNLFIKFRILQSLRTATAMALAVFELIYLLTQFKLGHCKWLWSFHFGLSYSQRCPSARFGRITLNAGITVSNVECVTASALNLASVSGINWHWIFVFWIANLNTGFFYLHVA